MQQPPVMPPGIELLYCNMMEQIEETHGRIDLTILKAAVKCVAIVNTAIEELKDFVLKNPFSDSQEEIVFFKAIKPHFCCQLIYYLKVHEIEINRPLGISKVQEKHLLKELRKLKRFFDNNREFYHYFRSGGTHLDGIYFLSRKQDLGPPLNPFYFNADPEFSTSRDFKVAKTLANEMLADYLNKALKELEDKSNQNKSINSSPSLVTWTAPKVGLAELIYALHASGVFNNTQVDIKKLADHFSDIFNIKLGNIYKIFEEIRLRKKSRTVFLDSLRQNLINKMDQDDENSL